ncbi:hypothetical protein BC829DRAFT_422345 [Chytridium lagenaria]|nr:hypothetical protein BC829DRAFT_422345 [Chytridium lagenaria]
MPALVLLCGITWSVIAWFLLPVWLVLRALLTRPTSPSPRLLVLPSAPLMFSSLLGWPGVMPWLTFSGTSPLQASQSLGVFRPGSAVVLREAQKCQNYLLGQTLNTTKALRPPARNLTDRVKGKKYYMRKGGRDQLGKGKGGDSRVLTGNPGSHSFLETTGVFKILGYERKKRTAGACPRPIRLSGGIGM